MTEKLKFVPGWVENIVGKGENDLQCTRAIDTRFLNMAHDFSFQGNGLARPGE